MFKATQWLTETTEFSGFGNRTSLSLTLTSLADGITGQKELCQHSCHFINPERDAPHTAGIQGAQLVLSAEQDRPAHPAGLCHVLQAVQRD